MEQSIQRTLFNISNEAVELAAEINKAQIHGLNFMRDGKHTSLGRIAMEITDLQAAISHLRLGNGISIFNDETDKRFDRKLAIFRMEDVLGEIKNGLPIPPKEFNGLIDFYRKVETFYRDFPVSMIHDSIDTISCINVSDHDEREHQVGTLTYREHAICDHFYSLIKEDKRPQYYIDEGISLEKFRFKDVTTGVVTDQYNYDQLWMGLAMMIYRWHSKLTQGKDNERKFIEQEINKFLTIIVSELMNTTVDRFGEFFRWTDVDGLLIDKMHVAIDRLSRIDIKIPEELWICTNKDIKGRVLEFGVSEKSRHRTKVYL